MIPRRTLLTGAPLALAACNQTEEYFGNTTPPSGQRLHKLAEAERTLMQAIPIVPLYFDSFSFLQKPFVRGLWNNSGDVPLFKYTSIDTQWRPS